MVTLQNVLIVTLKTQNNTCQWPAQLKLIVISGLSMENLALNVTCALDDSREACWLISSIEVGALRFIER